MALEVANSGAYIKVSDSASVDGSAYLRKSQIVNVSGVFVRNRAKGGLGKSQFTNIPTVKIRMSDETKISIPLGKSQPNAENNVSNQPTWLPTAAGLEVALSDIAGWG